MLFLRFPDAQESYKIEIMPKRGQQSTLICRIEVQTETELLSS